MRRTRGKFEHFLWGATLVTVGVLVCMTGRIEGGYRIRYTPPAYF